MDDLEDAAEISASEDEVLNFNLKWTLCIVTNSEQENI
jgi:hypothetical protein